MSWQFQRQRTSLTYGISRDSRMTQKVQTYLTQRTNATTLDVYAIWQAVLNRGGLLLECMAELCEHYEKKKAGH